jgi:TP901 family phage tail tape measure protein
MSDMNVKMVVSADNRQFIRSFDRSGGRITRFGKRISGTMRRAGREIGRFGDKIGGLTSLLGGIGIAAAGKSVIDLDTRLARLAIQAGLSKKEMFDLKKELFDIGKATHQGPDKLLEGIEQIVEKTGNLDFAVKSLKSMGYVASATGAEMKDIGSSASDLQEKMEITSDEVLNVFDILANQGKAGSFTLQNMAALFPRLLSSAASFNVTGVEGMRKFGAFLQIARRGAGSSEQAATAVERTFSNIVSNAKKIEKMTGFSIFDPEKSKAEGRHVVREMDVVLKEIIKRTKGDITKLQKIFGEESIRAMLPMAKSFQTYGDFREFDAFVEKGGDGATIMKDFMFWSTQTAAGLRNLRTQGSKFANENLAGPIELLNKALDILNNNPAITKGGLYSMLGLAGLGVGIKAVSGISGVARSLGGIFGRGGGKGIAGSLTKGILTGGKPIPVIVVNQGGLPGMGGTTGKVGKLAGYAKTGGKLAGAGAAGYAVGTLLNRGMGWMSGKATEGKYSGSGWLGEMIYDAIHGKGKAGTDVKNDIKINLRVDESARVFSESNDMNTEASVKLDRGEF